VLARLRQAEAALSSELAALRQAIAELAAVLETPPHGASLLTVVEATRELRVSRSRIFQLLASGDLEGVGSAGPDACRAAPSTPIWGGWGPHDQGREQSVLHP
jgi:hypothetical protein